jgi:NADPH:quinone reductase-like Zn-dependent oxidoreductase
MLLTAQLPDRDFLRNAKGTPLDRDRTPSIPGHELAGVVTALGYGTTGLSVGQRVFGLTDWYRDGTLAEYAAV